jgi:glycosyltransferase involved in cell wall biosynthesis
MKISVCMAAYNGAVHIRVQLASILNQLGPDDQIVVVDDASTDDTVQIVEGFKDSRIQLHMNAFNMGVVRTFNRALHLAQGDLIFLSDQDDRWYENKISVIREIFSTQRVDLIVHDAVAVEGNQVIANSLFNLKNRSAGLMKNFMSNTYTGCCMAFKREILAKVLPIPAKRGIFHDAWIGIMSEYYNYKVAFIDVPLMEWHRHDRNTSTLKRREIIRILLERIVLLVAMTTHIIRGYFKTVSH